MTTFFSVTNKKLTKSIIIISRNTMLT